MVIRTAGIERYRIDEMRTDLAKNVARKLQNCPQQCDMTVDVEIRDGRHSFMRCATTRIGNSPTVEFREDVRQRIVRMIDDAMRPELEMVNVDFHGSISVKLEIRYEVVSIVDVTNKVTWQKR